MQFRRGKRLDESDEVGDQVAKQGAYDTGNRPGLPGTVPVQRDDSGAQPSAQYRRLYVELQGIREDVAPLGGVSPREDVQRAVHAQVQTGGHEGQRDQGDDQHRRLLVVGQHGRAEQHDRHVVGRRQREGGERELEDLPQALRPGSLARLWRGALLDLDYGGRLRLQHGKQQLYHLGERQYHQHG